MIRESVPSWFGKVSNFRPSDMNRCPWSILFWDFYVPELQDIVLLKFWKSCTFPKFGTISVYIDVISYAFGSLEVKMSCYKIWASKNPALF